jgi:hypothetical protein
VLTALVGAWVGHLVEYIRVAGLQPALSEMSSSAHLYFFPAGASLMMLALVAVLAARRAWAFLGERLRSAELSLWQRPLSLPATRAVRAERPLGLFGLWVLLTTMQTATWVIQENLEAAGSGHRAPLLAVMSGVHWMAPLVQAEVALILSVVYSLVQRWFAGRRSELCRLERLIMRKWSAQDGLLPVPGLPALVPSTPLERWGAQRWQRPPPLGAFSS